MPLEPDEAEAWLDSLAGIGWRPGLERVEALCDRIGRPQDDFRSIHVVGTNGKTSTARSAAAILTARGIRNGCMTSPHFDQWSERAMVEGREVDRKLWARSVSRVRRAVPGVESLLPDAGRVTQFEASVAAELLSLAEAGVEVAVVEAGMGGRLDATNVLSSEVVVLTSVALDHTEWLGPTETDIAAEKLAVIEPGATLVVGPLSPEVDGLAVRTAEEFGCRLIRVPGEISREWPRGRFRRAAFELARVAVEAMVGETDEDLLDRVSREIEVPGRLQSMGGDPEVIFDVAHNPDGIRALAEALPEIIDGRPVIAVFGAMADKDHQSMLRELEAITGEVLLCRPEFRSSDASSRRAADPGELAAFAVDLGMDALVIEDPNQAVIRARKRADGIGGVVVVCGSHLLGHALHG